MQTITTRSHGADTTRFGEKSLLFAQCQKMHLHVKLRSVLVVSDHAPVVVCEFFRQAFYELKLFGGSFVKNVLECRNLELTIDIAKARQLFGLDHLGVRALMRMDESG